MERIGIFGGTFNPPHIGHIRSALRGAEALGLDKVLLIPARQVPGKQIPEGSPTPEQRLEMVRLAAAAHPVLEVSDLEVSRQGDSYTWQTLHALQERYPGAELTLMVGSDMLLSLPKWQQAERIVKAAAIAVLPRGGRQEKNLLPAGVTALEKMGARVTVAENIPCEISSTQLRRLLAFRCASEFLDPAVEGYIVKNGLYHTASDWKNLPMDRLEQVVIGLLNPNRVRHVLGCRDTAVELAKRWGADTVDAARAGMLHDVTKALDGPLQLTLCRAYGTLLDDFSKKYPKTLHALTGSLVAERIFGENKAVVSAIRHHTTGKADMNVLEAIIYVADYMEPNRDFPGVEELRALAFSDLQAALKLGLEMTLVHLKNQGSEVSPESRQALDWLKRG